MHGVALVVPMRHGRSDAVHGASSQLLRIRKSSLTRRTARRSNESSSIDGHEKCAHSVRCAHRWERLGADLAEAKRKGNLYNAPDSTYGTMAHFLDDFAVHCEKRVLSAI
ncbi:hypothetical protein [Burkholderia mayonis]|uniref:hypothetical protein n=1 Tax=Burkholderia mayonis TaxID=1385591 RepID=UPI001CF7CF9C|nr:hypothetical protein [Burkholderia mayonis]